MTGQLELVNEPVLNVETSRSKEGALWASVQVNGLQLRWNFLVQRDGEGWYCGIAHWMPGPQEWSNPVICRAIFQDGRARRGRPVPHDEASMAAFARWMVEGGSQ